MQKMYREKMSSKPSINGVRSTRAVVTLASASLARSVEQKAEESTVHSGSGK